MSAPSLLQNRLRSGRAALVVIDMQNDFCHADGALGRRGLDLAATQAMAPRLVALIAALRATQTPILYTRTCHDAWTDSSAWRERQQGDTGGMCRTGSWGAEFYGVAPLPQERVVIKHRYNGFVGTDLDLVLRAASIETLLARPRTSASRRRRATPSCATIGW
jgi:ureidoacrylate peracid hydrolase